MEQQTQNLSSHSCRGALLQKPLRNLAAQHCLLRQDGKGAAGQNAFAVFKA